MGLQPSHFQLQNRQHSPRTDAVLSLSAGDRVIVQNFCWLETGDPNTLIFIKVPRKNLLFMKLSFSRSLGSFFDLRFF